MGQKEPTSRVMSGKYKDCYIQKALTENLAYIDNNGSRIYLTQHTVERFEHLSATNTTSSVDAVRGAVIAGTVGAIAASAPQMSNLLKVVWKDGLSSVIKTDDNILEAIIIGMNTDIPMEYTDEVHTNDQKKKETEFAQNVVMWLVVALAWFAIHLFSNM